MNNREQNRYTKKTKYNSKQKEAKKAVERKKLTDAEIENLLSGLKDWETENDSLKKHFEFENFAESLVFVNKVGAIAEKLDHHPDISFGWGYAKFSVTTHDTGGLTHNDFDLAEAIERL